MESNFFDGDNLQDSCKIMVDRLFKVLPSIINCTQYGFLVGRDVLHNIYNVHMTIDYTKDWEHEVVISWSTHRSLVTMPISLLCSSIYDRVLTHSSLLELHDIVVDQLVLRLPMAIKEGSHCVSFSIWSFHVSRSYMW